MVSDMSKRLNHRAKHIRFTFPTDGSMNPKKTPLSIKVFDSNGFQIGYGFLHR